MLAGKLQAILKRQVPDEDKRKCADFIIDTVRELQSDCSALQDMLCHSSQLSIAAD